MIDRPPHVCVVLLFAVALNSQRVGAARKTGARGAGGSRRDGAARQRGRIQQGLGVRESVPFDLDRLPKLSATRHHHFPQSARDQAAGKGASQGGLGWSRKHRVLPILAERSEGGRIHHVRRSGGLRDRGHAHRRQLRGRRAGRGGRRAPCGGGAGGGRTGRAAAGPGLGGAGAREEEGACLAAAAAGRLVPGDGPRVRAGPGGRGKEGGFSMGLGALSD